MRSRDAGRRAVKSNRADPVSRAGEIMCRVKSANQGAGEWRPVNVGARTDLAEQKGAVPCWCDANSRRGARSRSRAGSSGRMNKVEAASGATVAPHALSMPTVTSRWRRKRRCLCSGTSDL